MNWIPIGLNWTILFKCLEMTIVVIWRYINKTELKNWSTVLLATAKSRLIQHCQMEKRDPSLQRTHLHYIQRFALHLVMYGLDAAYWPWKPIPWSSLRTVLELIWRPHEVWRSVAIDSAESWQLTVEYLVARKFHDWICCTGGILSRYHTGIHWVPESDSFFHKCL